MNNLSRLKNYTVVLLAAVIAGTTSPTILASATMQNTGEESFLMTVAQGQEHVIMLGQLATRKALGRNVKQFAAKMIEDHQMAMQEVRRLAVKEGIQLPLQVSEKQRLKHQELAKLWDHEFDREYMRHMLRDHVKEVTAFEQHAQDLQDEEIKRWASNTLPVLKQHLQNAYHITSAMIIDAAQAQAASCLYCSLNEKLRVDD